jgi:hypothetical protein
MDSKFIVFVNKNKIIFAFLFLIIYYEIKLYSKSFCHNKTVIVNHSNINGNDELLLQLNDKINGFMRFGDEFKNFILYVISRKTQNKIILEQKEIEILEELNK